MEKRVSNQDEPQNSPEEFAEDQQADVAVEEASSGSSETAADVDLVARIEALEAELTEAKEQALRAAAEMHNVRRRAEQDVEKAHKFGLEKFVSDMLPVADNLGRALEAAAAEGADMTAVTEGVDLTLKSLMDSLKKHGVESVNPEGEPFNPELHQAMTAVENPDAEPNTVINVYQVGYTLHGRLVRPAMVVVSK
ncbi:nucleotide exchange factor GrpE [Teredinibacter turnerae]|uniref:nucleotide exchange factor GrpE n=1 Tax=Teredinibacter turnerae TaxID=2426 RepID=UPI0003701233|nr:nucleotide exchange factor GrpE [Teredinibacter turnerae]